jgi:hypothetical protein
MITRHLAQSSSASRVTAAQAGFFILSQSGERHSLAENVWAHLGLFAAMAVIVIALASRYAW